MNKKTLALVGFFVVAAVLGSTVLSPNRIKKAVTPRTNPVVTTTPESTATPAPQAAKQTLYNTNAWYSSAYQFPSQPMFSYPGAVKIYEKGVGISVPQVKATEKTLYGSYDEMCVFNDGKPLIASTPIRYGDWNVDIEIKSGSETATLSLVQGMPTSYVAGFSNLQVACTGATISKVDSGVLVVRGEASVLFQGKGETSIVHNSESEFTISSPEKLHRFSVLTSKAPADVEPYGLQAWNRVLDSRVSYRVDRSITTSYELITELGEPVLTTIWPHHGRVDGVVQSDGRVYQTVLGPMKLVSAKKFSNVSSRLDLTSQFTEITDLKRRAIIINAIKNDADKYLVEKSPDGVYFKGTWIGALTTLVQLADLYQVKDVHQKLLVRLNKELESSLSEFAYDQKNTMYVAKKPEFGNEKGNDHHFHYGYYIRAAAVAGNYSPEKVASYSGVINEMIADISEESIESSRYPRLRAYSVYEGHSWADGVAGFADGNNQESTSESLNAWYAVWMWGEATGNQSIAQRGEWLFSQELTGTQAYWFGINNPFPSGYSYPIASLVWGGKRDFSTWFSPQPMHVYGIQMLPITPASKYLKDNSNGLAIEANLRLSGSPVTHEWGDLYTAYLSYFNPVESANMLGMVKSDAGLKLKSLLYQTVYSNQ
jgi:endo-1,3(4)-beta-glucanase